ncbi:hypothetical protein L208DRAFT_1393388 [Tricholoma matsutake]|nr:hypothetical protein L208DRAFT_1393388 [Tricholoma matsutake 945]
MQQKLTDRGKAQEKEPGVLVQHEEQGAAKIWEWTAGLTNGLPKWQTGDKTGRVDGPSH